MGDANKHLWTGTKFAHRLRWTDVTILLEGILPELNFSSLKDHADIKVVLHPPLLSNVYPSKGRMCIIWLLFFFKSSAEKSFREATSWIEDTALILLTVLIAISYTRFSAVTKAVTNLIFSF